MLENIYISKLHVRIHLAFSICKYTISSRSYLETVMNFSIWYAIENMQFSVS